MIKNIIFDIGEVLLSFRPRDYLREKYGEGEKADRLDGIIFRSKYWEQLDRGIITENEAKIQLKNDFPAYRNEIEEVLQEWTGILKPLPATRLLDEIRSNGLGLFYLSNFHRRAWEMVRGKYEFFSLFQGGVISARVGTLKPEEEIYRKLLAEFSLEAGECLFIDDRPENIDIAEKMGFLTHQYLDFKRLEEHLKRMKLL